jgi:putative ABC transport system permease protein
MSAGMTWGQRIGYAAGALSGHRGRSALTLLATGIGVAAVVVLTALGEGARRYVVGEFASLGTHLLIVLPGRTETSGGPPPMMGVAPRDLTVADMQAVLKSPHVLRVAPVVLGTVPVAFGGRSRDTMIAGSTADLLPVRNMSMAQGRFLPPGDPERGPPVAVLGGTVRDALFGAEPAIGRWVRIGDRRFKVIGILASRGTTIGMTMDEVVIIPVSQAQALFNAPGLFRALVQARSRDSIEDAKADVVSVIRARHEGDDDVTVITQDSVLSTFDQILTALTLTVAGIGAISLVVAGILVMNVMLVSVSQRTAEIGLLKALGAKGKVVMALFLAEAAVLSLAGALVGLVVGYAAVAVIGRVYPDFPVAAPAWAAAAGVTVALVTGVLFGVWPARRAARLDPVASLARR